MSLLPSYIAENQDLINTFNTEQTKEPIEYGIDFNTGQLTGLKVKGLEAIKVWAWLALQVPRYRHTINTWDYGNELLDLIGQGFSEEYIQTEGQSMIEDCLLLNENITGITDLVIKHTDSKVSAAFTMLTTYGEIEANV